MTEYPRLSDSLPFITNIEPLAVTNFSSWGTKSFVVVHTNTMFGQQATLHIPVYLGEPAVAFFARALDMLRKPTTLPQQSVDWASRIKKQKFF